MSRVTVAAVLSGVFLLALAVSAATQGGRSTGPHSDCTECHTCELPTAEHPCLKKGLCPRHEDMSTLGADAGPGVVVLGGLMELYEPVVFDHKKHAEMTRFSGGCETCHHFTPPGAEHPACKDCHPPEIAHEDIAQPGLKGAYHRSCMGCHTEWDNDTSCEICHERRSGGAREGATHHPRHYEPVPVEELILFETAFDEGDRVPFHHRNHAELYERDCNECHQEQSCKRCHVQGEALHPMGDPGEIDLHDICYRCHKQDCEECHGRDPDDLFNHASTGWPLRAYHARLNCCSCHTKRGAFLKLDPRCETCHRKAWNAGTFNHSVTGVALDDIHREADCGDCHVEGVGRKASCDMCHDDGRTFSSTGFPD